MVWSQRCLWGGRFPPRPLSPCVSPVSPGRSSMPQRRAGAAGQPCVTLIQIQVPFNKSETLPSAWLVSPPSLGWLLSPELFCLQDGGGGVLILAPPVLRESKNSLFSSEEASAPALGRDGAGLGQGGDTEDSSTAQGRCSDPTPRDTRHTRERKVQSVASTWGSLPADEPVIN